MFGQHIVYPLKKVHWGDKESQSVSQQLERKQIQFSPVGSLGDNKESRMVTALLCLYLSSLTSARAMLFKSSRIRIHRSTLFSEHKPTSHKPFKKCNQVVAPKNGVPVCVWVLTAVCVSTSEYSGCKQWNAHRDYQWCHLWPRPGLWHRAPTGHARRKAMATRLETDPCWQTYRQVTVPFASFTFFRHHGPAAMPGLSFPLDPQSHTRTLTHSPSNMAYVPDGIQMTENSSTAHAKEQFSISKCLELKFS